MLVYRRSAFESGSLACEPRYVERRVSFGGVGHLLMWATY
jgi:hypothetical protein